MKKINVGIFVGSLRKGSYSRHIANWIVKNNTDLNLQIIEIGQLPIYNQDYDESSPKSYDEFREKVSQCDAFLFITPEYNRSIPAVLKNAIDVASRPWGKNVWTGKPGGIISQSTGNIGGFGANHHLRQVLSFVNVFAMDQPECYVSNSSESISENGEVNERLSGFLSSYMKGYNAWINKFLKGGDTFDY